MKPKRTIFLRRFGKGVGYICLFVLISVLVYIGCIWAFTINNIVVIGNNIQVQVDESRLPRTLLLFPSETLRTQLLKDNPILADIRFQKKYPHTLVIIPTLRTPVARLSTDTRTVLIDTNGMVIADAGSSDQSLPQIKVPLPAVRIGETVRDPRVVSSILFITGLRNSMTFSVISTEDDQSLRARSNTLDILFAQNSDMHSTLATLQTLLTGFRIKGTLPSFIDLRFDKPVIKF